MPDMTRLAEDASAVAQWLTRPGSPNEDHALGMLISMQMPVIQQQRDNSLPSGMLPFRLAALVREVLARKERML